MTDYAALVRQAQGVAQAVAEPWATEAFRLVLADLLTEDRREHLTRRVPEPRPVTPPDVGVPVNEFLALCPLAVSHPGRAVAIAYWQYARTAAPVTVTDLNNAYRQARQKRPQNWPDVIASCIRRGWLIEAGRSGAAKCWALTDSGARLVEGDRWTA